MSSRVRAFGWWFAPMAVLACSGGVIPIGGEGSDASARDGAIFDGAQTDGGGGVLPDGAEPPHDSGKASDASVPECPAAAPTLGARCAHVGLECEYGDSTSTACNELFLCASSGWTKAPAVTPAAPTCVRGSCPSAYPFAQVGEPCSPNALDCSYPQGTCTCASPSGPIPSGTTCASGAPCWQCFPAQKGCPTPRPPLGSQCGDPGLTCNYGSCADGIELVCEGGIWKEDPSIACPQ